MPRIDPLQLLKTLSVLLSSDGGIKSGDEVVRLVQLMQKFSKKLVSKSIYIEILRATTPSLLEKFLNEKGWELLNLWFSDSIKTQNWPLCQDIISLFSECPITAALLKDTVDVNQAPKLINQLRINPGILEEVRALANIVYLKWVAIVSPQPAERVRLPQQTKSVVIKQSQLRNVRRNIRGGGISAAVSGRGGRGGRTQRIISSDFVEDSNDSSSTEDSDEIEYVPVMKKPAVVAQPPVTFKIKVGGASKNGTPVAAAAAVQSETVESLEVKESLEEDGPISLLKSLADEVSENLNKEKAQNDKEKKVPSEAPLKRRKSDEDKKQKEKAAALKEREKEKEKEKKRKQQQISNPMDERERKRFRPDRRDEVDPEEKQRIKEKARLLKEEVQAKKDKDTLKKVGGGGSTPHTSTFSRIPKIPKKLTTPEDSKTKDPKVMSFTDLLGNLDAKPKTVKTPMVKNKTAALLEGFSKNKSPSDTSSSSTESKRHSHHHSSSHHHHHHHSGSPSSSSKRESNGSSSRNKESSKDKKEMSPASASKEKRHSEERHKSSSSRPSKLAMPKRNSFDLDSPKGSGKNNTSFSESTGFMDAILGSMTGEDLLKSKKKRRLSERDDEPVVATTTTPVKKSLKEITAERAAKAEEAVEEKMDADDEDAKPMFSFYRDTLEEPKEEDPETGAELEDADKQDKGAVKEEQDSDGASSPVIDVKVEPTIKKEAVKDAEDNLPFEEPVFMPREVKGILVYHRGKEKRNKSIQFKKDAEIVTVRYFELDEDERVNVNKIKFENMRQIELKMEKAAFKSKDNMGPEENDLDKWTRPIPIDVDNREPFVPGHGSLEKDIQFNREKTVLAAFLYSKETTPDTPSEPDAVSMMMLASTDKPICIPVEDQSNDDEDDGDRDFSKKGWPEPQTNQVDRQANFETDFSLNPALSNLLSSIESSGIQAFLPQSQQGLSQDEINMLKAQTEAMAKLGIIPGVDIPPSFPPPRAMPPGVPPSGPPFNQPPQMHPKNVMPPMNNRPEFNNYDEGPEFYENENGPPPRHLQQGFNNSQPQFDRGNGRRFNHVNNHNFHPQQHPGGPGQGGPRNFGPHNNRGGFRGRGSGGPPMRGHNDFYRERYTFYKLFLNFLYKVRI